MCGKQEACAYILRGVMINTLTTDAQQHRKTHATPPSQPHFLSLSLSLSFLSLSLAVFGCHALTHIYTAHTHACTLPYTQARTYTTHTHTTTHTCTAHPVAEGDSRSRSPLRYTNHWCRPLFSPRRPPFRPPRCVPNMHQTLKVSALQLRLLASKRSVRRTVEGRVPVRRTLQPESSGHVSGGHSGGGGGASAQARAAAAGVFEAESVVR